MEFKKYQHVEKFRTSETEGIDIGECFIFPKIDGTNGSIWFNGDVKAGSRNRELSVESDNAGFCFWVLQQENIKEFFKEYPNFRLYGEWLVKHTINTYRKDAWQNFYVFDVMDEYNNHISYDQYKDILNKYEIEYIPPITKVKDPSYELLVKLMNENTYLIEDGKGIGEGIVVKNYSFTNKYGRTRWAKLVTNDFKANASKAMGVNERKDKESVERKIVEEFVTESLIEKEFAKIALDGWESKKIPQFLHTVYYNLIKEESWEFIKKNKNPTIDFKRLMSMTYAKAKEFKPEVF
jgi:hypothetical protein